MRQAAVMCTQRCLALAARLDPALPAAKHPLALPSEKLNLASARRLSRVVYAGWKAGWEFSGARQCSTAVLRGCSWPMASQDGCM